MRLWNIINHFPHTTVVRNVIDAKKWCTDRHGSHASFITSVSFSNPVLYLDLDARWAYFMDKTGQTTLYFKEENDAFECRMLWG